MLTRPILILTVASSGCAALAASSQPFQLAAESIVHYTCAGGNHVVARYSGLSDGSLNFVRLTLPNGQQITLPQVASGSGARFSADQDVTWWSKGTGGFLQRRDANGQWQISLDSCVQQR